MSEPIQLDTLARQDMGGELRLTLERSERGRVVVARLWRRDASGTLGPTRFGISIRIGEIRRVVQALEMAENMAIGQWTFGDGDEKLTPKQRMDRFFEDVGAPPRKKI